MVTMKQETPNLKSPQKTATDEKLLQQAVNKLADIELKIDHVIRHIYDSLYRIKQEREESREEFP